MSVIPRFIVRKCPLRTTSFLTPFNRNYSNEKYILHSDLPDVEVPQTTIHECFLSRLEKWPNFIAKECVVTGRKYTYDDIRIKSRNFSRSIRKKLKLEKGDIIAFFMPNVPEYTTLCLGAFQAGLTVTTINPIYSTDEVAYQLQDSTAKILITTVDLWDTAKQATEVNQKRIPIIALKTESNQSLPDGAINLFEFLDENIDYPDLTTSAQPGDTALMLYSSGTTGKPKGVEVTHSNGLANLAMFQQEKILLSQDATDDFQDVITAVMPKCHVYGLTACGFLPLYNGCKTVCLPKFDPDLYIEMLKKHKPNILHVVPPLLRFLTIHPELTSSDFDSVRKIVCSAAPLGLLDEQKFKEKVGRDIPILQGYGLTEATPMVAVTRLDLLESGIDVGGSVGRLISNTSAKIINPDDPKGSPLGPNTVGELLIKGPQIMKGYFNKPKETQETFLDGWLRSGDMAYYNNNEILFITDRLKDMIKVKGFQVAPAELEEIIRHFPGVAEAAVIGVPHETDGEVPKAFITLSEDDKIDFDKLNEFVSSKVAPFKQLKGGIEVVDYIPKNVSGKILKRELKMQYNQK